MATPMPPAMMGGGGPPVQPPQMPTLSAAPMPPQGMGPEAGMPQPGQVGALPKLFFGVEQQLQTLAKVLPPDLVADLDSISQNLRAVLVKALQSGASAGAQGPMQGIQPQPPLALGGPAGPAPTSDVGMGV
jgi:hypothetical protein